MFSATCLPEALIGTLLVLMMSNSTWAATFNVTSNSCSGTGSIVEAFQQANSNPGPDTIDFDPGLTIRVTDGACGVSAGNDASVHYIATVTDDVTINGNGAVLQGDGLWIKNDGRTNATGSCPNPVFDNVQRQAPGFVRVNPNVSIDINDIRLQDLYAVLAAGPGSTVNLDNVAATDINDWFFNCDRPPINVLGGGPATINITDSSFGPGRNAALVLGTDDGPVVWPAAFVSGAGTLNIDNTVFSSVEGSVQWAGGTANIQTSRLVLAGGINITSGTANIVNTAILGEAENFDRLRASGSGTVLNFTASTMAVQFNDCQQCKGGNGVVQAVSGATVNLSQSAIGYSLPSTPGSAVIREGAPPLDGDVRADTLTWIQPIGLQEAGDLRTITDQPGLLTDAPGLPTGTIVRPNLAFPFLVTPLLGPGGTPGVLIDAVPDANGANQLLSPIDGSPLTRDPLGTARVDLNNRRNIGAIQLTLAPLLAVGTVTPNSAALQWTRPLNPSTDPAEAITGYGVIYEPTDGSAPATRIDVSGPDTVSTQLTGLMPGTDYRVTVVAVNVNGDGPPSSITNFTTASQSILQVPTAVPTMPVSMLLLMAMLLLAVGFRKRSLLPGSRS